MALEDSSLLAYFNETIATTRDQDTLFRLIAAKLRLAFPFDALAIITLDADGRHRRIFVRDNLGERLPEPAALRAQRGAEYAEVAGTPLATILADMHAQPRLRQYALPELLAHAEAYPPFRLLYEQGLRFATMVPLRTGGQLIGLLSLLARQPAALTPAETEVLEKTGNLLAGAVTNALAFEDIARRAREQSAQLALNNTLLRIKEREALLQAIATEINRVLPFQYFGLLLPQADASHQALAEFSKQPDGTFRPLAASEAVPPAVAARPVPTELLAQGGVYVGARFQTLAATYEVVRYTHEHYGMASLLCVPLALDAAQPAALVLASPQAWAFDEEALALVRGLAIQVQLAIQNALAFERLATLQQQLERERTYLIDEINTTATARFGDFVGGSAAMQRVFQQVGQVAALDTTVLVTGETGTGKELVARALHEHSPRRQRPLIKLNCAALPAQLIESELFGHEKGAFTGAHERRIGKFELANRGTLFLDEVGELPLDLQAKLLRVLQEKEFERLGGNQVLRADVRIIAATNRVLAAEVAAGRFRADLYFRLDVFPIHLPALRERPEDIEALVRHFLERFTRQFGKPVRKLRARDLQALQRNAWPGNIRELEHVVERAVIASTGPHLEFAGLAGEVPARPPAPAAAGPISTLREHERAHILAALAHTGGRVSGPQGAAVLLDINPKTLETRMQKLGIRRGYRAE